MAHMNDVRPISITIHQDKKVMPCICTEVNSQLLKWPSRRGFESNGLPRVRREMILALLAGRNDIVDIVV